MNEKYIYGLEKSRALNRLKNMTTEFNDAIKMMRSTGTNPMSITNNYITRIPLSGSRK
jgi:hypothetical protein